MSVYMPFISAPTGDRENRQDTDKTLAHIRNRLSKRKRKKYCGFLRRRIFVSLVCLPMEAVSPELALKRMKNLQATGAKAVLVASYGNRAYEDTLLESQRRSGKTGI